MRNPEGEKMHQEVIYFESTELSGKWATDTSVGGKFSPSICM